MVFLEILGGYLALAAIFYIGMTLTATERIASIPVRAHKWQRARHLSRHGLTRRLR
jgi:hypothetical protein